jgi:hypothetical protein
LKVLERIGVRGKENFFQEVFLPPHIKPKLNILQKFNIDTGRFKLGKIGIGTILLYDDPFRARLLSRLNNGGNVKSATLEITKIVIFARLYFIG